MPLSRVENSRVENSTGNSNFQNVSGATESALLYKVYNSCVVLNYCSGDTIKLRHSTYGTHNPHISTMDHQTMCSEYHFQSLSILSIFTLQSTAYTG